MTLFFSKMPQTFEVVRPQPACLANAGDALRFAGIIPQNQVNSIKNLLPTHTVLVSTLRASLLLKSDKKKKTLKENTLPTLKYFNSHSQANVFPLWKHTFMKTLGRGEIILFKKIIKTHEPQILAEFSETCRLLLYIIRNKTKNTSLKRVNIKSLK